MKITITGRDLEINDALYAYASKKIGKLDRFFDDDVEAVVRMSLLRGRHICEVTIPVAGYVLRAEEAQNDMYSSIDRVSDKLERQVRKHRTRLEKRLRETAFPEPEPEPESADESDEAVGTLVRTKRFRLQPMTVEEAITQMEMLGHTFFLFQNEETGNECVVYARDDGNYGLLIPEKMK